MGCVDTKIQQNQDVPVTQSTIEFASMVMNENKEIVISLILDTYHQQFVLTLVLKANEENSFVV